MKILIVYATHGGVAKRCAEMLGRELEEQDEITYADGRVEEISDPQAFDVVIIGSSVRFENIDKRIKKYVKNNLDKLCSMPCGVYLCCGFTRLFGEYSETLFPKRFKPSLGFHLFGGELKPDKLSGFDKIAVMIMRGSIKSQDFEESDSDHHDLPEIIPENISLLAKEIRIIREKINNP